MSKKCRDRYVLILPENAKSIEYLGSNAITGVISDENDDGRYENLVLYFPAAYTGVTANVFKMILSVVGQFFNFAKNVEIKQVETIIDEGSRLAVFGKTQSKDNIVLTHLIVLKQYLNPEQYSALPNIDQNNQGDPQTATGNEVVPSKVPGYLYVPVKNTPLVLNPKETETLELISSAISNRDNIFKSYDLESVLDSKSMCFLFHGPSGTGKTQAAKFLAKKLDKKLLIVDHAKLLDKYVGETEKRIAEVFQFAESNDCILLFDEADSLIGSRSDAEHSWEIGRINTLLQHMEKSNSITLFATNFSDNLDNAINRRLLFKVEFTLPDVDSRKAIWKALIPDKAPKAKINYNKLAEVEVTGGEIKNALVVAIIKCASTSAKLSTDILMDAVNIVVRERLVDLFKLQALKNVKKDGIGFKQSKPATEQLS